MSIITPNFGHTLPLSRCQMLGHGTRDNAWRSTGGGLRETGYCSGHGLRETFGPDLVIQISSFVVRVAGSVDGNFPLDCFPICLADA